MLGGPDMIVEIDESMFSKKKINRGKRVNGSWVFGGTERSSSKCFFQVVQDRSKDTLLQLIKSNIKERTTVISDCLLTYLLTPENRAHPKGLELHPTLQKSSVRDAEIILRAGQRIISEINILVENSQGSSQIPKSNPQLLNAEIKKKIARHENIKIIQSNTVNLDMQDYLEKKLENMLTSFQAILEKQTTLIMEAFQKTMESVLSHLSKIFEMGKSSHSPLRKKKAVGNKSSIHKTRASSESDTSNNIDME
ncbi:DDE_Tnp_IS1595 domain-containing protein [Trichonephila clavipes]|nr:DDE_Tnp_IS1595 domain-containing protein [Trichonephila clavipes]